MNFQETNDELLGYPFDQYQRYQDVRMVIEFVESSLSQNPSILDLGGSPTAVRFLSDYNIISANLELGAGVHVQCDGIQLPFSTNSMDIVISVDTLEHVAESSRKSFIKEILRVSRLFAIITGPFGNGYNETAEIMLNEFLEDVVGIQHRFLTEHIQNGLPDLQRCLGWIRETTLEVKAIPSGYIHHWLPLMIIKHYLMRISDGQAISKKLDRLYNYQSYWGDHRLPSYRQLVIAAKLKDGDVLNSIEKLFKTKLEQPIVDLSGVIGLWKALDWLPILEEKDQEIKKMRSEIDRLNHLVSGYKSGRLMRLLALFRSLLVY